MPIDISQIEIFVLVFIRTTAALAVMPVFSHSAVIPMAKAGFAVVFSLLLVPTLSVSLPQSGGTLADFFLLAIRETLCGIMLGFVGYFLFYSVEIAGQLIGFQTGFSVVTSIDPNTEAQSTIIAQIYNLTALMIFLAIDGHHVMLRAIADSLRMIPVGTFTIRPEMNVWALNSVQTILGDGVRMAAPLMATLLLTDVGLGILVRVAPTLNVFVLGFPLKIAIAFIMIALTLGAVMSVFTSEYGNFVRDLPLIYRLFGAQ